MRTQDTRDYEWFGASLPAAGQAAPSNADCFRSTSLRGPPQSYFGVVCDGVSSSAHGREAARIACEAMVSTFERDWSHDKEPESWLLAAVRAAHHEVRREYPRGESLCTAVCALVLPREPRGVVAHAGDCRAYLARNGQTTKLTEDHASWVPVRVEGRLALRDGVPVMAHGVTKALGQNEDLQPHVESHGYREGDRLCLASDGVPQSLLARFMARPNRPFHAQSIEEFCREASDASQDDASLLVIQLGSSESLREFQRRLEGYGRLAPEERESLLDGLLRSDECSAAALAACLGLEQDEDRAIRIVDLMARDPAALAREAWIALLDAAAGRGQARLAHRLVLLIRRL